MRRTIIAHTCLPFLMRTGIWNHLCLNVCDYMWSTCDGIYPQSAAVMVELYEIYFSQICCWQNVFLIMTNRAMDSSLSLLLPYGNSSTCTSCKRRWRVGGLWAEDDQVAWRGQHPEEAQGSYELAPAWVKRANRIYSLINTCPMTNAVFKKQNKQKKTSHFRNSYTFTAQKCRLRWLKMLYFEQVKMGWISWLMFMINPRKNNSASLHLTAYNQLWHIPPGSLVELELMLHDQVSDKRTYVLTRRPLLPQRLAYFSQVLMSSWGLMTSDLTIRILCQSSTIRWQP